jgi:hypothetical protein
VCAGTYEGDTVGAEQRAMSRCQEDVKMQIPDHRPSPPGPAAALTGIDPGRALAGRKQDYVVPSMGKSPQVANLAIRRIQSHYCIFRRQCGDQSGWLCLKNRQVRPDRSDHHARGGPSRAIRGGRWQQRVGIPVRARMQRQGGSIHRPHTWIPEPPNIGYPGSPIIIMGPGSTGRRGRGRATVVPPSQIKGPQMEKRKKGSGVFFKDSRTLFKKVRRGHVFGTPGGPGFASVRALGAGRWLSTGCSACTG